ncbi:hypothetical protein B0H16DRAFT_1729394 [Mycena metata]|uniref:F-box domain-containing protein n=1 Tax=Mycena metata TaxID=1033252 RepID=A0AAD7N004_9AGAR|nr:hypothetical protein B0H16DRAFT_1729394 [Mycena metata]
MDHCLKIVEIVDMICSHLDPPPHSWSLSSQRKFRDLAAMARTCKAFQHPALDYLWRETTLEKLVLRCMPSDLWAVGTVLDVSETVKIIRQLRPVRDSDWDCIRLYAPRVKTLYAGHGAGWPSSAEVLPILAVSLPESLFDNLRRLTWQHKEDYFHHIRLFLHSTLTSIHFWLCSDASASLFPALTRKCPNLTEIFTPVRAGYPHDSVSLADFICGFKSPEYLSVPSLDHDVLQHLAGQPTLRSLSMTSFSTVLTLPMNERRPFSGLRKLSLLYPKILAATQFFGVCIDVPLREAEVTFSEFLTPAEFHDLFAAASGGVSHSSLTDLYIETQWDCYTSEDISATNLVRPLSVRLLLDFANLTTLFIRTPIGFDLDNNIILDMARAWRQIQTLQMLGTHLTSPAELSCMSRVLCAKLPTFATPLNRIRCNHQRLDVEHSPISAPISIARFLSRIFPKIRIVQTHWEYHDDEEEEEEEELGANDLRVQARWNEVKTLLPEVLAIREEEKALARELRRSS